MNDLGQNHSIRDRGFKPFYFQGLWDSSECKNTTRVSLDDVAKEVGLTHFLNSNAVVMISTGEIGGEARRYANKVMTNSNLCIVMVDGHDLAGIETRPASIVDVFSREAKHAMDIKKLDL